MTQTQAVLNHLRTHGNITPMEALNLYGCYRLSDVIYRLRKNHEIATFYVEHVDRFGNHGTYARYVLLEEVNNG